MRKVVVLVFALVFCLFPLTVFADEGPMTLPDGSNPEAVMHNQEGIKHFNKGHLEEALKHFHEASDVDSTIAETHFNEAVTLDKLERHGEATMHFQAAKKHANGNAKILNSPILNAHIGR